MSSSQDNKRHKRTRSHSLSPPRRHSKTSRTRSRSPDITTATRKERDVSDIPKAVVTESNGEISCSIEESNRIRALLGLKPLKIDTGKVSTEAQAVQNFKNLAEEEQKKVNAEEAKARIEKARNKRLLRSKLDGQTLGDLDQDETSLGGASNWVERSRQKAEELKRKKEKETAAEALAKRLQEEEEVINDSMNSYSAKDLQGVEVLHAESNFVEGESIILTLADSNILETNERGQVLGLNTDNDVLENINMTEEEKRLDREKKKKRLRQPIYSGYDDAEFEEGTASGKKPNILSQYDKEKKRGPQMRLGEGGQVVSNNTGNDELGNSRKAIPQSLQVEKANTSLAEYLTPAEYATFSKSKKDKVKKKRKIRKKETSSGLIEELEAALDVEKGDAAKGADRGSRISSGETTLSRLRAQENDRRQAYQNAAKIANEKTSGLAVSEPSLAEMKESEEDIDDDADIVQSLERARRLALSKKSAKPKLASSCHEDEILEQIRNGENVGHIYTDGTVKVLPTTSSTNNKMEISNGGGEQDDDFVDAEGRRKDGTLVFTSTTEFTTRLQAHLQEKARSKSAAVIKEMELAGAGTGDVDSDEEVGEHNIRMGDVEKRKGGWVELEDASDDEGGIRMGQHSPIPNQKRLDQDDNDEGENTGFGAQPVVARGMAATLELLKGTGDLKKKKELAGRAKDAREQDPSAEDVGVKLEYRDEFGRKMTQKEAFRQLSYRFHGIQPGKKKKAKRLQEYQDEVRAASSKLKTENSGTMRSLTRTQAATGKAYLTVQGGPMTTAANIAAAVNQRVKQKVKSKK